MVYYQNDAQKILEKLPSKGNYYMPGAVRVYYQNKPLQPLAYNNYLYLVVPLRSSVLVLIVNPYSPWHIIITFTW
jgi:hypothetical protein